MAKKTIQLDELPEFVQKMVMTGHTVTAVARKGRKVVARFTFKLKAESKDVVRIPCLVVPESSFARRVREGLDK